MPAEKTALNSIVNNSQPPIFQVLQEEKSVLVVPDDMSVKSLKPYLDEWRTTPERRTGTAVVKNLDSLIKLAKRFKDKNSAIFAEGDIGKSSISASMTAILDYHPEAPEGEKDNARFGQHRISYNFPVSKELQTWIALDAKPMSQIEFAAFIEDRIGDVISKPDDYSIPDFEELKPVFATPSQMVSMSRGLEATVKQTVKEFIKLESGETHAVFISENTTDGKKPLVLPGFFLIQLPIFKDGAVYRIPVRLRNRIQENGKAMWWFEMYRIDRAFDHAFKEACEKAETETELPVFNGQPEK